MIYLCISDSHLFCAQWTDNNGKSILSNMAYKPLQKSITDPNRTVNEIVSDISLVTKTFQWSPRTNIKDGLKLTLSKYYS